MPRTNAARSEHGSEEPDLIESLVEPGPGPEAISAEGSGGPPAGEPHPEPPSTERAGTRERILDVALDLFVEHGFDGTSLRQIAEELGITKAALYYYFASKDDILMALHMRLHEFGQEVIRTIGDEPVTLESWAVLLGELTSQMMDQRKIFLLHERNQATFEKLHRKEHMDAHEDLQARFRTILADPRISLRDRVRMAGAFGVVFAGLFLSGDAFSSASNDELWDILNGAVQDVLEG
jgi:AcrR family transcriptional regulator